MTVRAVPRRTATAHEAIFVDGIINQFRGDLFPFGQQRVVDLEPFGRADQGFRSPSQQGQVIVTVRDFARFGTIGFREVQSTVLARVEHVAIEIDAAPQEGVNFVAQHAVIHAVSVMEPAVVHCPWEVPDRIIVSHVAVTGLDKVLGGSSLDEGRIPLPFDRPDIIDQSLLLLVEQSHERAAQVETVGRVDGPIAELDVQILLLNSIQQQPSLWYARDVEKRSYPCRS